MWRKKEDITKVIDETIREVCKEVQETKAYQSQYADIVKALAALVEARALL